jgi:TIR domain
MYGGLTTNVANLVASRPGEDPGFMDMHLESGVRWRDELLEKVDTCQVFVALLTASYVLTSRWCAMEWDLFMKRSATRKDDGSPRKTPPVIPVLWAPIAAGLPAEIAEVERFIPSGLPSDVQIRYRDNGIFGLYRTDRGAYDAVVWSLAMEISRLHHKYTVEPSKIRDTAGLREAFSGTRPTDEKP